MESLNLDLGVVEYAMPGGVLRMNPTDPNVYGRFLELQPRLEAVQKEFSKNSKGAKDGLQVLTLLQAADRQLKEMLGEVFPGNDFHTLLGGMNLLAVNGAGQTLAECLLASLEAVLSKGAKSLVDREAEKLMQNAKCKMQNVK